VVVPQKEFVPWRKASGGFGHSPASATASNRIANFDENRVVSSLKELVTSGDQGLDRVLAAIADAARSLTGASGTALAMWKDGAMVCRARSGHTAPPIGARLSADTGISGECLRTGQSQHCSDTETDPLVDVEVCRTLGLRSIAALPIQGWRAVNGILEAFSTVPAAFSEHHIVLLEELAALAERARALQPHGAFPVVPKPPVEKPARTGLLPASDRVRDVILALVGRQSRPLIFRVGIPAAILLVGFAIWLGWRGPGDNDGKAHAASASSATTAAARLSANPDAQLSNAALLNTPSLSRRLPDNDPVWKPNPGGELLSPSGAKPSAGYSANGSTKAEKKQTQGASPLLSADAASVALPQRAPETDVGADTKPRGKALAEEAVIAEPPLISGGQTNSTVLNGVLSTKALLPSLSTPVSQGISGGRLVHRVQPVYPNQAKTLRLEGKVVLNAMVMEDGRVRDLKVEAGHPTLAQAAMEAVKQWRYQPYVLNGKPVKRETSITIDFKLPSEAR
jgi:TonB family protein